MGNTSYRWAIRWAILMMSLGRSGGADGAGGEWGDDRFRFWAAGGFGERVEHPPVLAVDLVQRGRVRHRLDRWLPAGAAGQQRAAPESGQRPRGGGATDRDRGGGAVRRCAGGAAVAGRPGAGAHPPPGVDYR